MDILFRFKNSDGVEDDLEFQTPNSKRIIRPILTFIPRIGERVKIADTYFEVVDILHKYTSVNMDLNSIIVWLKEKDDF